MKVHIGQKAGGLEGFMYIWYDRLVTQVTGQQFLTHVLACFVGSRRGQEGLDAWHGQGLDEVLQPAPALSGTL